MWYGVQCVLKYGVQCGVVCVAVQHSNTTQSQRCLYSERASVYRQ